MNDKPSNVDAIQAIKPDRDEVAAYRRGGRAEAPKQSNFNGILVFSLIVLAIMIGVGGFTLFEVQKQLDHSNALLEKSLQNLRSLENELARTGSKSSKTFQSMETQLKTNVSEIDKLWAIAHRQNKPKIEALEVSFKNVNTSQAKLSSDLGNMSSTLATFRSEFTTLSKDMTLVRKNIIDDSETMTTQVAMVRGQIQDQADLQESTKRGVDSLNKKITQLEEAVNVFDRYRLQVNQKILDLEGRLLAPAATPVN
ncbi:MAG: chromosome segregation ATPase [Candidatus Azotimanducaceae bacterium]|jgi:chromosome segregation ATPase